ncbi:MAG: L,D-transpeptidase family protein [Syntrophaceae bacterium]|nr:L,D-transpeptidase family protein [Syntrophaceae bacterium]
MKNNYRKFYRIFLILFLLSFSANLFMLTLYLKERKGVPTPLPKESKGIQEVKETQEIKAPLGMVLLPFVHIKNKDYFLLCDKQSKILHLYRSEEGAFSLIKSYPCIVGSNNVDKKEPGDLATPEGIYFLTSFLAGKDLPEKYGYGAFVLNYPNFLDKKEGKKGSGIWLHGSSDRLERPPFSEGCIVVKDEFLKELIRFIKIGDTPMVIVDTIQYKPVEEQQGVFQLLSQFLKDWKTAWESRDSAKYLSFYSRDFVSSDGKSYQKFKEYKYRVNQSKKFIQLQMDPKCFLLSQKDGGQIAVVRMNQDYRSDNFKSYSRKILYLKEKQGKWEIIGEVTL